MFSPTNSWSRLRSSKTFKQLLRLFFDNARLATPQDQLVWNISQSILAIGKLSACLAFLGIASGLPSLIKPFVYFVFLSLFAVIVVGPLLQIISACLFPSRRRWP